MDVPDEVMPEPEFVEFDGKQFNQLFLGADLPNLASIDGTSPPVITGNSRTDARIREIATRRGYDRRPEVLDRRQLVRVEGKHHWLQPLAAQAYLDLKVAAGAEGHHIHITSAFRSYDTQRRIFLLYSAPPYTDKAINQLLKLRSIPGYSKHHTGYAIDVGEGSLEYKDFASSESYAWLSADNYLNAKKYGWIPGYPPDATKQGPDPEPWEFTFVGRQYLLNANQSETERMPARSRRREAASSWTAAAREKAPTPTITDPPAPGI